MHDFKIFKTRSHAFHNSQLFFWAQDVGPNRQVYVEENPRPGKRYEDAHILFYAVGLGITILLMYLGVKPLPDLLMFRSTWMRQNLPFEVWSEFVYEMFTGFKVLGWSLRRMSTFNDEPSKRQFANFRTQGNMWNNYVYILSQSAILCHGPWLFIFFGIYMDNPIIHLRPLTTWAIMTVIHPLRNLLIGVLGSYLGHAWYDLFLNWKFWSWIGSTWIVMFVVLYIMHVFVVSKRILNHLAGFCSIIFANMFPLSKKTNPGNSNCNIMCVNDACKNHPVCNTRTLWIPCILSLSSFLRCPFAEEKVYPSGQLTWQWKRDLLKMRFHAFPIKPGGDKMFLNWIWKGEVFKPNFRTCLHVNEHFGTEQVRVGHSKRCDASRREPMFNQLQLVICSRNLIFSWIENPMICTQHIPRQSMFFFGGAHPLCVCWDLMRFEGLFGVLENIWKIPEWATLFFAMKDIYDKGSCKVCVAKRVQQNHNQSWCQILVRFFCIESSRKLYLMGVVKIWIYKPTFFHCLVLGGLHKFFGAWGTSWDDSFGAFLDLLQIPFQSHYFQSGS